MDSHKIIKCVIHGIKAVIALYASGQVWGGMEKLAESFRKLDDPYAGGLSTGMMLMLGIIILSMCLFAAKNILQVVLILKKPDDEQFVDGNEDKLINYTEKVLVFLEQMPPIIGSLLLMTMGAYVMYMAAVGRAESNMYGIGLFFIAGAGFIAYTQIKRIITSVKGK